MNPPLAPKSPSAAALERRCAEAADLRRRLAALESGQAIVEMGRRLMSIASVNERLRAALRQAEDRNAALARECSALEHLLRSAKARDGALAERLGVRLVPKDGGQEGSPT
jgi:flagellar motility protein MotE (MotC chaperone)